MQITSVNFATNKESKSSKGIGSITAFDSNLQMLVIVKRSKL